ncbi:MAG: hypothetical protein IJ635_10525 [Bacteroidaceae bacterium]|nr:hypothetical protein [Bacteroidaceae bacterium]
MKRFILALATLLLCLTSQAQSNPKIDSLVSQLRALGDNPEILYIYDGWHEKHVSTGVMLSGERKPSTPTGDAKTDSLNAQVDSIMLDRARQENKVFQTLKEACKSLAEDATESYMWEYHRGGVDSIYYSIAMGNHGDGRDSLVVSTGERDVYYLNAPEVAYFHYTPYSHNDTESQWAPRGYGWFNYVYTPDSTRGENEYLNIQAYTQSLLGILKQKGVESYPIYLSHDSTYTMGDDSNTMPFSVETKDPVQPKSETRGTVYTIRSKELAEAVLSQIVRATWQYLDEHPHTTYHFRPESTFRHGALTSLFSSSKDTQVYEEFRVFIHRWMEDEYSILVLNTQGDLWIPCEWPILQSWKNGKMTFNKKQKRLSPEETPKRNFDRQHIQRNYTVKDENEYTDRNRRIVKVKAEYKVSTEK